MTDAVELAMQRRQRQTEGLGLFDAAHKARAADPITSHLAAQIVVPKATSQRGKLLLAHLRNPDGLTDREAASSAGVSLASEYATRCSELVRCGWLRDTADTRLDPDTAQARMVRRITDNGMAVAHTLTRSNV